MMVSWTPLSLSEARGFITHYTVAYFPQQGSSKRQEPNTMYKNVSGDSDQATIDGLEASIDYGVQVSASTNAGSGDFSPIISAKAPKKCELLLILPMLHNNILAIMTAIKCVMGLNLNSSLTSIMMLCLIILHKECSKNVLAALAQEIGVIVGAILAVILVLVLLIIVIVICVK